ncbi:MAG TPA: accessory gene regulator B family protein [Clostridiales bacterium]|nr:accessory gene regulator B family protein [Clostridiales bacterium]
MMVLIDKIGNRFVRDGIITEEDKELYTFGMQQGIIMLLNIISTIIIGIIFNMVWQSVVFLMAYMPLRSYAGGYHARTQGRCYLVSLLITVVALLGMKEIQWTSLSGLLSVIISAGIIYLMTPVEDANKPLSELERIAYKKKTRRILLLEILIALAFWFINQEISVCFIMIFIILSIMLLLGAWNNKRLINKLN